MPPEFLGGRSRLGARKGAEMTFPSAKSLISFPVMTDERISCHSRSRRRGHIKKLGQGRFQLRWEVREDPTTKKRIRRKRNVRGSKRDAERVLAEELESAEVERAELARAEVWAGLSQRPDHTLGEWLDIYFDEYCRGLRPSTLKNYRASVRNHVSSGVLAVPLKHLRPGHLQRVFNRMLDRGLSVSTVRGLRAGLQGALTRALKEELVQTNAAGLVDLPPLPQRDMKVFDADQARTFLTAAANDRWSALWTLLITCGLRPSEALGLRWPDLAPPLLSIRRSLVRSSGGEWELGSTKTGRVRVIELPVVTLRSLGTHRAVQDRERRFAGSAYVDHDLIFARRNGEPLELGNLKRRHFFPILRAAGLPRIRLYDLRHTAATLRILNGDHVKTIQHLLGHRSSALTLNVYSHVLPAVQHDSAARMDALLTAEALPSESP